MRNIKFMAICPYEIGDKIQFGKCGNKNIMTITDIITQTSARTGRMTFILELDEWYFLNTDTQEFKRL